MINNFMTINSVLSSIRNRRNNYDNDDYCDGYDYMAMMFNDTLNAIKNKGKNKTIYNINKIKSEPSDHKSEALNLHKEVNNNMLDLGFLGGLTDSETTINSENTSNYIAFRTDDGSISFSYDGDQRLTDGCFSENEKLIKLTTQQHQETLTMMNTCEWDKKVDFVNGEFVKVEKYTDAEKAEILIEREKQESISFYNKEKRIAIEIIDDSKLELNGVTETDMTEVKQYMNSIKPIGANTTITLIAVPHVQRPLIMEVYEKKQEDGWL